MLLQRLTARWRRANTVLCRVLVMIVSSIALMAVLWLRYRQGRILRRLMRSLTDEQLKAAGLDVDQIRARFGPYEPR